MPIINIEGVGPFQFPDNMSRRQILRAIEDEIIPQYNMMQSRQAAEAAPPQEPQPQTSGSSLASGADILQRNLYSAVEGIGNVTGLENLRRYGQEGRARNVQEAEASMPQSQRMSFEQAETVPEYLRATGQVIGESLPSSAVGIGGAVAGEQLAKRIVRGAGLKGRLLGALLGSSTASTPLFYGSNRQRQIEETGQVGSEGAAFAAAVPQAVSEGATDILLGRIGRLVGLSGAEVGASLLPRILRGAGLGGVSEVPAEIFQQILERAQAGLDLLSSDAMREYKEAAIGAFAAGTTMGGAVAGVTGRRPEVQTEPREEENKELYDAISGLQRPLAGQQLSPEEIADLMAPTQPSDVEVVEPEETQPGRDLIEARFAPSTAAPGVQPTTPSTQAPQPQQPPPAPSAAAPAPIPASQLSDMFAGMGRGIGESLRDAMWMGYSEGTGPFRPEREMYVRAAKDIAERRGEDFTRDEFDQFITDFSLAKTPDQMANVARSYLTPQPVTQQQTPPVPQEVPAEQAEYINAVQQQNAATQRIEKARADYDEAVKKIEDRIAALQAENKPIDAEQKKLSNLQSRTAKTISNAAEKLNESRNKVAEETDKLVLLREEQAQQQVKAKATSAAASKYVNEELARYRKSGEQGARIADALEEAISNPEFNVDQLYVAFVAAKALNDVLPKTANHRVQFLKSITVAEDQQRQAAASGGEVGAEVGGYRVAPTDTASGGLIAISLSENAYALARQTASHEAFHVLQDYYGAYDPNFMRVSNAAFKDNAPINQIDSSIRRKLQNIKNPDGGTYWEDLTSRLGDAPLSRREAQAYVYGALYDAAKRGVPMTGLKPSMTRFVSFLKDFFSNMKNFLKGNGFNNVNDLFGQAVERGGSEFTQQTPIAPSGQGVEFTTGSEGQAKTSEQTIEFAAIMTNMSAPEFKTWWEGGWRGEGYMPKQSAARSMNGQPIQYYHGTQKQFSRFGKARSGSTEGQEGPFFFSPEPAFSGKYAEQALYAGAEDRYGVKSGQRMLPVFLSVQNPFDTTLPENQQRLLDYVDDGLDNEVFTWKDLLSRDLIELYQGQLDRGVKTEKEVNTTAYIIFKQFLQSRTDNWQSIESKAVQKFLREGGYDGFFLMEDMIKNIAVFDPRQIKSIFNQFAEGAATNPEFAVLRGNVSGLPQFGSRVPPVTPSATGSAELNVQYDVVSRYMGKKFGKFIAPEKFEKFFASMQDRMLPVGRMIDDIKAQGGSVPVAMDAYLKEDLLQGKVADMLEKRGNALYKPLIEAVSKAGVKIEDFENYLYARHAPERNAYIASINSKLPDGGSGLTNAQAAQFMSEFKRGGLTQKMESLAKMFDNIIADTNKLRVDSGLTPDFSKVKTTSDGRPLPNYKSYAPLRGFADESIDADEPVREFRPKTSRMLGAKGREDKRMTGRTRMAGDIIAHAIMQNTQAVIRSERNKVGQAFLEMVRANAAQSKDLAEVITSAPLRTTVVNGSVKTVPDMFYKNDPDILVVKENGREVAVRIYDEGIAKAMTGASAMAPASQLAVVRGLAAVNRFLAKVNTAYNPEFILTNFARDLQTFGVNVQQFDVNGLTKDTIKDLPGALSGVRDTIRGTNNNKLMAAKFQRFKALGGTTEMYGFGDLETRIKEINEIMASTGTQAKSWKDAAKVVKPVIKFIEDYNTVVENGIRTSLFKNLVDRGFNEDQAAQIAKNVTVNFTKGGENRVLMNSLYLFYNASLQGSMAMMNAIGRSPKVRKVVAGIVAAGVLQDVLNSVLSGDDDDGKKTYDKIPDHILKRSFVLMDPFKISERGYFSFPMPYGFNAFFNMGREMSKTARGKSEPMKAAGNIVGTFVDAFNPIGGTESFLNFVAPTILDPIVDLTRNRDFAGRPIVPERGRGGVQIPESQKYWNNTFAPYVGIAQFLNEVTGGTPIIPGAVDISPNVIKYAVNYAIGGVGKFAERTYNTAFNTIPSAIRGDLSEVEVREVPIIRSLYGNVTTRNDMESYIKNMEEVLRIRQEIRDASQNGQTDRISNVMNRYPGQVELMESFSRISRERSKIAQDINKISRNPNIPDDSKKDIIKSLRERQNALVGLSNKLYNERVGNR